MSCPLAVSDARRRGRRGPSGAGRRVDRQASKGPTDYRAGLAAASPLAPGPRQHPSRDECRREAEHGHITSLPSLGNYQGELHDIVAQHYVDETLDIGLDYPSPVGDRQK